MDHINSYNHGIIVLVVSVLFGLLSSIRYIKEKRHIELFIVLAAYLLPPYIFYSSRKPIALFLSSILTGTGIAQSIIDFGAILILLPIMVFWIFWLLFGGYALIEDELDMAGFIIAHFKRKHLMSKIAGITLMIIGLFLLFFPIAQIGPNIWLIPFVLFAVLSYFKGAIYITFPKDATEEIDHFFNNMRKYVQ